VPLILDPRYVFSNLLRSPTGTSPDFRRKNSQLQFPKLQPATALVVSRLDESSATLNARVSIWRKKCSKCHIHLGKGSVRCRTCRPYSPATARSQPCHYPLPSAVLDWSSQAQASSCCSRRTCRQSSRWGSWMRVSHDVDIR